MKTTDSTDKYDNLHCYYFEDNGTFYLYDYSLGIILELTEQTYISLSEFIEGNKVCKEYRAMFEKLISQGLILGEKNLANENNDSAYLTFAPVYDCNFRCKYCFGEYGQKYNGKSKKFTSETLKLTLDYFFYQAYPNFKQYRIDFVSGGEPLLGFDIIKQTVEYIENYKSKHDVTVKIWLCTNAALLTEKICQYLDLHNVQIGISIDGEKKIHNKNRIDKYGAGTYDTVINRINSLKANKNLSKKFKHIWGLSVASDINCDFVSLINHHKKVGFKSVQIKLVRSSKSLNVEKINTNYSKLASYLFNKYKDAEYDYLFMILNDNDQFGKILKRILLNETVLRRCCAGLNKITICPDGSIYPCDSFVGLENFCIGSIYKESESSEFSNATVSERNKCCQCQLRYICGGDCYYNSYINNTSILEPSSSFCRIQEFIIKKCIILRYRMEMFDAEKYNDFIRRLKLKNEYK